LNKSLVLEAIVAITWKRTRSFSSISSKISSSLEDEVESSIWRAWGRHFSRFEMKKRRKTSFLYSAHESLNLHFKY
jgi:hypothetical protein